MDMKENGETDPILWEVIATAAGMAEANIIVGRLESEGIPTRRHYEAVGPIYAVTIDGLGEVQILVPAADWERANEALSRSYEDGDLTWEPPAGTGSPENA
jgi:hypothetical protein